MNVFDAINNQETLAIILWLIGAFLIGFITAWMYWRRRYDKLQATANDLQTQLTTTTKANAELSEKLGLSEVEQNKLSVELQKIKARVKSVEVEKGDLHTEIYKLKDSLKQEEEAKLALSTQLEQQSGDSEDVEGLKTALETANTDARRANARVEVLRGKVEGLQEELAYAKAQLNTASATTEAAEETLASEVEAVETAVEHSEDEIAEQAKDTLESLLGSKISVAAEGEQDDLKAINGIGPFIEAKLNELGIRTYRQVSELDKDAIDVLTKAISFFPGRIERDNWVSQAKTLMEV